MNRRERARIRYWLILALTPSLSLHAANRYAVGELAITWERTFGGTSGEIAESVRQTGDGGFIMTGVTQSFGAGNDDVYLIRTDAEGNELCSKTFGGSGNDYGHSVQQTADGGFIMTGFTQSFGAGSADVYLIRTDTDGDELWSKTFGGGYYDSAYSVQQTADGGFIIAGKTLSFGAGRYDVYLIRTDTDGNELWSKTFGGSHPEFGRSVRQTADGGFIVAGYTESFSTGGGDVYLIRTDTDGNELWSKTFGGGDGDFGWSVQQTADGAFIIAGGTRSFGAGKGRPIDNFPIFLNRLS